MNHLPDISPQLAPMALLPVHLGTTITKYVKQSAQAVPNAFIAMEPQLLSLLSAQRATFVHQQQRYLRNVLQQLIQM